MKEGYVPLQPLKLYRQFTSLPSMGCSNVAALHCGALHPLWAAGDRAGVDDVMLAALGAFHNLQERATDYSRAYMAMARLAHGEAPHE